ncbi:LPD1 domain-containing protein [Lewinella sp. W8]|uniref:LPD1 domain-containing protein n=1 Tax=Lewinella sp. W8 TaxID=2528208 RepID=UPI00106892EA|nr:LPD1 domain-containing protein [Lewinella sp. W8]MTB53934.1 hypothetical protein [Lewinella sp. W8]
MKFLLLLFNNGDRMANQALQTFATSGHPNVDRIFECVVGSPYGCPIDPATLNVTSFPRLVFMAVTGRKANGEACYRHVRDVSARGLSRAQILTHLGQLSLLPPIVDFDCSNGNLPGGEGEGQQSLLGMLRLPSWLLMLGTAYAAKKTLDAKSTLGRVGYGAIALTGATKYFSLPPEERRLLPSLGAMPLPEVGKTTDYRPIKPGSRVAEYWQDNASIAPRDFTGRKKRKVDYRYSVGVEELVDRYGLHSIEFGNWVPQDERQQFLVGLDESLADLAKVFGVAQNKVGLGRELAIAYGARGRGGRALATYWPGYVLINLNREKGIGSLAHEYGHALDYRMAVKGRAPSGGRTTSTILPHVGEKSPRGMMERALAALILDNKGETSNWRQKLYDYRPYYQQRNEIWARTFEAFVAMEMRKKSLRNDLLVHRGYGHGIYPTTAMLKKARPAIMAFCRYVLNGKRPKR